MRSVLLSTLTCGAAANQFSFDIEDPWTVASLVILSFLFMLCLIRVAFTFFSVSIETEVTEVEMGTRTS